MILVDTSIWIDHTGRPSHHPVATSAEVLSFVESHTLFGDGLSLVDPHLLAALRLSSVDRLWTRDRRLHQLSERLRGA